MRTEMNPQISQNRKQKAESRRQKAEGRRQKAEGRKQMAAHPFLLLPLLLNLCNLRIFLITGDYRSCRYFRTKLYSLMNATDLVVQQSNRTSIFSFNTHESVRHSC